MLKQVNIDSIEFFFFVCHRLLHCPQLDDLRNAHIHLFQTSGQTLTDLSDCQPPMLLAWYVSAALLMHQCVLLLP